MKTFEIQFTLEEGTEVEADNYKEAQQKGLEEMERILGKRIANQGYIIAVEK